MHEIALFNRDIADLCDQCKDLHCFKPQTARMACKYDINIDIDFVCSCPIEVCWNYGSPQRQVQGYRSTYECSATC